MPGDIEYGEPYKNGDIITICLDLKQNKISFGQNETNFGIVPEVVFESKPYRLAMAMYQINTIV